MKNLILFSIFLLGCSSVKMTPATQEDLTLRSTVEVPGIAHNDIYIRDNAWMVKTFNNAESVIQYQDKEAGRIIGKYHSKLSWNLADFNTSSIITIEVKDERARITFSDPHRQLVSSSPYADTSWHPVDSKTIADKIKSEWSVLVHDFTSSLTTPADEDW